VDTKLLHFSQKTHKINKIIKKKQVLVGEVPNKIPKSKNRAIKGERRNAFKDKAK
jgi:hypothetical protein